MTPLRYTVISLILLIAALPVNAQPGKDGGKVVSSANTVVNEYTTLSANVAPGGTSIQVASNVFNSSGNFAGPLGPGDLIFIIQLQGATPNCWPERDWGAGPDQYYGMPYDSTWGEVVNYNNCGNHEFAQVAGVNGSYGILLDCGLQFGYSDTGKVQVIRVPRYSSLNIVSGSSITCPEWNGTTGGVVAIEVLHDIFINSGASITATAKGFRGGELLEEESYYGGGRWASTVPGEGAEKGESIIGYQDELFKYGGKYSKGAPANGGGGGNGHNGGGGGGANAGNFAIWSGKGVPDVSVPSWAQAWNLEYAGFATHVSSGGGRGGYTFSSQNLNALAVGPGNSSWSGDYRKNAGGFGGRPLDYSLGKIFMGGGGGSGDQDGTDGDGGPGGRGGGVIFVVTHGNVTGTGGQIIADGEAGHNAQGSGFGTHGRDAAGGGGGGGTIMVKAKGNISGVSLQANGGDGGDQVITTVFGTELSAQGPGGGGGGGYIAITNGAPTRTANGGQCGTTNSDGLTEFLPNGSTKGGVGVPDASISTFRLDLVGDSFCAPGVASLNASLAGSVPPGTQIEWYDSEIGGTLIGTGTSFTTPSLTSTTTYYVTTCPGYFRDSVVAVAIPFTIDAGPDITLCAGGSADIEVTGGGAGATYLWAPTTNLNPTNTAIVTASPTTTITYSVTVTSIEGCVATDEVVVTIGNFVITASPDTMICAGGTANLSVTGGTTYLWSPGGSLSDSTIANPLATPYYTTTYSVQISNSYGCSASDQVTVTVDNLYVNAGPNIFFCPDDCHQINAVMSGGTGPFTFSWLPTAGLNNPAILTPIACPDQSENYIITVSGSNGCSARDSIVAFVNFPVPVNAGPDATICNGVSHQINATAGNGSPQWVPAVGLNFTNILNPIARPDTTTEYTVCVTDGNGCVACDSIIIYVSDLHPVVGPDTTLCDTDTIQLHASGGIIYSWSPSAGLSSATSPNPIAIVNHSTTYTVDVENEYGCTGTGTVEVIVSDFVFYAGSDQVICPGQAGVTIDADCPDVASFSWSPTTGLSPATSLNPLANPFVSTTYTLTAENIFGCSGTGVVVISIASSVPTAEFTLDKLSGCPPLYVNFTDQSIDATSWFWNFGSGTTSQQNPSYIFASTGTHTISLLVYDTAGCSDMQSHQLVVFETPTADFSLLPLEVPMFEPITISNNSTGAIYYFWDLSSAGTSIETEPALSFEDPGVYEIVLTVENDKGCIDSTSREVTVAEVIELSFPNVVTPNADGFNDVFRIKGIEKVDQSTFAVFNRWGQLVYESLDYQNDWGFEGLVDGTYYYFFTYLDQDVTGVITVISK
ncbi:MAG: gliding motility-associated C-terminal domain-containing protein [Bacteroidetes bacterium]|nr:gliding motility-associated C-terminal domain-containing protein [Bacteroidota bacterium]MBU1719910.1 gliding motility-associated C-terminal domain-containing protein [Bacteroidota bacterium]